MIRPKLYLGDCLKVMDELIAEGVKVDAIISDPPFGSTACRWDSIIPLDEMWPRLNKLIKLNGAIVLFGIQPFTSKLIMSNAPDFKYEWIWKKNKSTNFLNAKKSPLRNHENILFQRSFEYISDCFKLFLKTEQKSFALGGSKAL